MKPIDLFKHELSHYLNNNSLFFYWKGRVALYAVLRAMGVQAGDEVILPAYTCVVVPNAVIYAGAKPVYVDIDLDTFSVNLSQLESAITAKTKVILCQNTFGLSANIEKIVRIAQQHQLYTIEDCCHGFGGQYQGQPNGSFCDAAFFSMQWNKPFSAGLGGFALINNPSLLSNITALEQQKTAPSFLETMTLRVLYGVKDHLLNAQTYWVMQSVYRFLSKHHLIVGSSQGDELSDVQMPENYFKDLSFTQVRKGVQSLQQLPQLLELRKRNAARYAQFLTEIQRNTVSPDLVPHHSFLKYPLLVQDKAEFFDKAQQARIPLGDWFSSPLHPVTEHWDQWQFEPEQYPHSMYAAAHMVNLPTDTHDVDKVIRFLAVNQGLVINNLKTVTIPLKI